MAGPVRASGYGWYRVAPVGVELSGGATDGWVAVADQDGTPWVALAKDPTPGFELAVAAVKRAPAKRRRSEACQATAINAFGVGLYKRMLGDKTLGLSKKGVVFSPASIAMAIAMARAGAAGNTAAEMDTLLRVKGWDQLGAGISALDQLLASRDASWTGRIPEAATPCRSGSRTRRSRSGASASSRPTSSASDRPSGPGSAWWTSPATRDGAREGDQRLGHPQQTRRADPRAPCAEAT